MWNKIKEFTLGVFVALGVMFVAKEMNILGNPQIKMSALAPIATAKAATPAPKKMVVKKEEIPTQLPQKRAIASVETPKLVVQKVAYSKIESKPEIVKTKKIARKVNPNTISLVSE